MADKNEIVLAAAQPTAVEFPQATNGMVNTGSGIQVGTNAGTINLNINCPTPGLMQGLMSMFAAHPAPQKVSHKLEWASLNQERYCLFVLENEDYNCGAFSIAKNCALCKYTAQEHKKRYANITPAVLAELASMPCIFAKRNMHFGYTEEGHPALLGRITDMRVQGETIKVCFTGFQGISQQLLNQNIGLLGMVHASLRNELDEEHWSIKNGNLIDVMARLHVDIE